MNEMLIKFVFSLSEALTLLSNHHGNMVERSRGQKRSKGQERSREQERSRGPERSRRQERSRGQERPKGQERSMRQESSRTHETSRGQDKSRGQDRSRGQKRLRGQERQAILQDEPRTRRSGRDGLKLRQETRETHLASRDVFVSPHTTQSASTDSAWDSDCGPSCHNLLHQLGHPKEAERCPAGQVLDIWGYCRY